MARISGVTVLLILVATVSVYTWAKLADDTALGRTAHTLALHCSTVTTKQPEVRDIVLRISVGLRGLAEDFAKELWGGNHRQGLSVGGARPDPCPRSVVIHTSAARASVRHTQAELDTHRRARAMPVSSDTELRGGYHREEGRLGVPAHDGVGAGNAATLTLFAAQANLPVTGAELQYRERLLREAAGSLSAADRQILMRQIETIRSEMLRQISFDEEITEEITEETRPGPWGVVKVGPWGGSGGDSFYMLGGGGGSKASRLQSVTLYHADAVHALFFEYLLEGVGRRRAGGGGGPGSKGLRATINFSSDEQLTAVEGTFGHCRSVPEVVVTSLTFRTNKGRTYGPYGEETGTPFSVPAANGCIVGFWGSSRSLVDAIGVYIMPCQVNKATS